jgi:hypothetical protein
MSRDKFAKLYETVIERNPRKRRYSSISVDNSFLVAEVGRPSPLAVYSHPAGPFVGSEDSGISVVVRLDGYALAPLRWYRDRGIDPVAMRDEDREYRETFFSIIRRQARRWPEIKWRILHPTGRRVIDVERL